MLDRQVVWSDEGIRKKLKSFVLCADEVWSLQHRETAEAKLFREFSERGHYGGRGMDFTRQGIYVITPGGQFLGSWNTRSLKRIHKELDQALAAWEKLEAEGRAGENGLPKEWRWSDLYPIGGAALRVYTRDMPRTDLPEKMDGEWRRNAWNQDRLWLKHEELIALRDNTEQAKEIVRRIVRLHGRDNARGQSSSYSKEHILRAEWSSVLKPATSEAAEGDLQSKTYLLSGFGSVKEAGEWAIDDRRDKPARHSRSFAGEIAGEMVWKGDRCVAFEMAWVGLRKGATQFNGRADDPGPAPMGVVFTLAGSEDRVPPSMIWQYGWR